MIKKDNLLKVLEALKFDNKKNKNIYIKKYDKFNTALKVDFDSETLIYPESDMMTLSYFKIDFKNYIVMVWKSF